MMLFSTFYLVLISLILFKHLLSFIKHFYPIINLQSLICFIQIIYYLHHIFIIILHKNFLIIYYQIRILKFTTNFAIIQILIFVSIKLLIHGNSNYRNTQQLYYKYFKYIYLILLFLNLFQFLNSFLRLFF